MAGIYIHIPFCKRICSYCDFYKTTFVSLLPEYINTLELELIQRNFYLEDEAVDTIYFGGGTPSVLSADDINRLILQIKSRFTISKSCEITLEANPDDLSPEYLIQLHSTDVNRLSIGVQSFMDKQLKVLNRRHSAVQAFQCIENAKNAGFNNISLDLIYGLPGMTHTEWVKNLETAFSLDIQHLSAYHLTIEPNTAFSRLSKRGLLQLPEEEESAAQFIVLHEWAMKNGFIHYEISNLCREGYYSTHNTNYWRSKKYLGIGPAAHSYNIESRQWNIADVKKYMNALRSDQSYFEKEPLAVKTRFNEYIMISLRTIWGVDLEQVFRDFGEKISADFERDLQPFIQSGKIIKQGNIVTMTPEAWLISDHILTRLMKE
jgi:oxygen-independent coproporphyrinogen-3 oxidase